MFKFFERRFVSGLYCLTPKKFWFCYIEIWTPSLTFIDEAILLAGSIGCSCISTKLSEREPLLFLCINVKFGCEWCLNSNFSGTYPNVNSGRFKLLFVNRLVFQYVLIDEVDGLRIFIHFHIFSSIFFVIIVTQLRYVFVFFDDR